MKIILLFIITSWLSLFQLNPLSLTDHGINFRDTCDYIDYGTKVIRLWSFENVIFDNYGKISQNCLYGHGGGYLYYDSVKKIYLGFGIMDGCVEEIIINTESINHLVKEYQKDCKYINLKEADITTRKGIKIGMSKNEIKTILGEPCEETENSLSYYAYNKNCLIEGVEEYLLAYCGIYTFENDKLVMIELCNSD